MKASAAQKNPAADGRHARSERTRTAVAAAMFELIVEGVPQPTAQEIATRAGVSARAVFRHFDNLEALLEEVARQQVEQVSRALPPLVKDGPLEDRVAALVANSVCRNELIAPVRRAVLACSPAPPLVRERHVWLRGVVRNQVRRVFASELARLPESRRPGTVAALRGLLSFSYWQALREHEGLSKDATMRVLRQAVSALLLAD